MAAVVILISHFHISYGLYLIYLISLCFKTDLVGMSVVKLLFRGRIRMIQRSSLGDSRLQVCILHNQTIIYPFAFTVYVSKLSPEAEHPLCHCPALCVALSSDPKLSRTQVLNHFNNVVGVFPFLSPWS